MIKRDEKLVKHVKDLEGKTIKKIVEQWESVSVLFEDGTYTTFMADKDIGDDDPHVCLRRPTEEELGKLGAISAEEYEAYKKEMQARIEASERSQYEQLKKKFEK